VNPGNNLSPLNERLGTRTAPDRATTRWEYDAQGRLSGWFDPMGHASRFESDPWGRLLRITDPEQRSTRYQFAPGAHSPRIQLQTIQHADGGQERLDYDRAVRLQRITNAAGRSWRLRNATSWWEGPTPSRWARP